MTREQNIGAQADNTNGAGCVSRTRMFRFTRAVLYLVQPSRRKLTNGQRRRLTKRKRPCNRDYRFEQSAAPLANSGRSRCQTAKHSVLRLRMSADMRSRSLKRCVSAQQIESS